MKSVATGAAGSKQLDTFGPKILKDDYAPGFFMKHFIKDMKLALIEANRKGLSLDVLSMVLANYEELEQEGYVEYIEGGRRAAAPGDGDRGAGLVLKGMPACIEGAIEG